MIFSLIFFLFSVFKSIFHQLNVHQIKFRTLRSFPYEKTKKIVHEKIRLSARGRIYDQEKRGLRSESSYMRLKLKKNNS